MNFKHFFGIVGLVALSGGVLFGIVHTVEAHLVVSCVANGGGTATITYQSGSSGESLWRTRNGVTTLVTNSFPAGLGGVNNTYTDSGLLAGSTYVYSGAVSCGVTTPGSGGAPPPPPPSPVTLTLTISNGYNSVVSGLGITCSPASSGTCTATYSAGTTVILTAIPSSGTEFSSWSGPVNCPGGVLTCTVSMTQNRSVTASFSRPLLSVVKSGSGAGTVNSAPPGILCGGDCVERYPIGSNVTLTATPAAGSVFVNWARTTGFPSECTGSGSCVVAMSNGSNRSVTAVFDLAPVLQTLTVGMAGSGTGTITSNPTGINCGGDCTEDYTSGTDVTLTATSDVGSVFAGWSGACTGMGSCMVAMSTNRSVTANFVFLRQLQVLKTGSGTGIITSSPGGINCGGNCTENYTNGTLVTLTANSTGGSTFAGWSGDCSGNGVCTVTMSASRSVTADFTAPVIMRTFTVVNLAPSRGTVNGPGGINCGGNCTASYPDGAIRTFFATPNPGSSFGGWSGACAGFAGCSITFDADKTVSATFNPLPYTLSVVRIGNGSVVSAPGGITCGASCSGIFDDGTSVTLTATPGVGSSFTGWSGASCSGAGNCTVVMSGDTSVTASFALVSESLSVTVLGSGNGVVSSVPAGIMCNAGSCTTSFSYGTSVTLTANPSPGSTFGGWSGDCMGAGTCTLAMDGNKIVEAVFDIPTNLLSILKTGEGSGTVVSSPAGILCGAICNRLFNTGTVVTLTATPTPGSIFSGWSGPCVSTGVNQCTTTMNVNKTVIASFLGPNRIIEVLPR